MNNGNGHIEIIVMIAVASAIIILAVTALKAEADEARHIAPVSTTKKETHITKALTRPEKKEDGRKEDADDLLIARVVMAEAGSEPFVGKVAVATTILNRAECRGMTISEVVYEKNQYASPWIGTITTECTDAVAFARENRDLFPHNMVYFRRDFYHSFGTAYTVIGKHYFSTEEDYE